MEGPAIEDARPSALITPRSSSSSSLWQQQGGGNVKVVVRVKPDASHAAQGVMQVRGSGIRLTFPRPLEFDGFSWVAGPESSQDDIMARVGEPMVESLRGGFNSTILAYGDSGSGKTHTMLGPAGVAGEAQEGLIPRVLRSLFSQLAAEYGPATIDTPAASIAPSDCGDASVADDGASSCCGDVGAGGAAAGGGRVTWAAEMAFLQVYKQAEITNLLSSGYLESAGGPGAARRMRLAPLLEPGQAKLPRDVVGFLRRKGAMVSVSTAEEALARLQQGARLRCTCATVNNAESSRSHAVFLLELRIRTPRPDGSWVEQTPRLVMMDLAGSEGFESSANAAETTAINTGLLFLGNVLRELADAGERPKGGSSGGGGPNFNNHNLTRFLEHSMDSRGRGGKVALIVTVRPTPADRLPHSLWFAKKALSIKITAAKNEHLLARDMDKLAQKLQLRIEELEIELQRWRDRHDETVEAARRELAAEFEALAAGLEARHKSEAADLQFRIDDLSTALEAAWAQLAESKAAAAAEREAACEQLMQAQSAATAVAAAAAEAGGRHEREVASLQAELVAAKAIADRERREAGEAAADEVEQLRAALVAAEARAAAAEARAAAAEAQAAAASSDAAQQLERGRAAQEAAQQELSALRRQEALKRQSLLMAKAVVREVREDEVSGRRVTSSDVDAEAHGTGAVRDSLHAAGEGAGTDVAAGASPHDGARRVRAWPRHRRASLASLGSPRVGGNGESGGAPPTVVDGEDADDAPADGRGAEDQQTPRSARALSPTLLLSRVPGAGTPAAKMRMMLHAVSSMQWEAADIMGEHRSPTPCPGTGSDSEIDGDGDGTSGGVVEEPGAEEALPATVRQLFSPVGGAEAAAAGEADAAADAVPAPQQAAAASPRKQPAVEKKRRVLQPPQLGAVPAPGRPRSATERARPAAVAAAAAAPPPPGRWPQSYPPEPSAEDRAVFDAQILSDMEARQAKGGKAPPARVTVELLVAALQGKVLRGVEWRRGGKKRHDIVRDYLAWAATNPPEIFGDASGSNGSDALAPSAADADVARSTDSLGGASVGSCEGAPADEGADPAVVAAAAPAAPAAPLPAAVVSPKRAAPASPPRRKQQPSKHPRSQPSSPGLAALQGYDDSPPPIVSFKAQRQERSNALSALYAAGSRKFCESQLPGGRGR